MNVSNDTVLLPRGCPVAPLKNVSGTIVTPKKLMDNLISVTHDVVIGSTSIIIVV